MKVKEFNSYSWFIVVGTVGSLTLLLLYGSLGVNMDLGILTFNSTNNSIFVVDFIGFSLSILTVFLAFAVFYFLCNLNKCSVTFVGLSLISSIISFNSNHALVFWWFYEMSILTLLYLLVVDSPYSERYIAGWYLAGYVVLTSLPMLLCIIYFVSTEGNWQISEWQNNDLSNIGFTQNILIVLGILFITKIPLPPFHVWLPLVHAEATSIVSVCLSGYIMKLGLLGLIRFCWWVSPNHILNLWYVGAIFCLALIFFLMASWELDGKRWLALLSLSHIIISVVCINNASFENGGLFIVYSVGHGLSAGLIFIFLWWCYELSGSRNWLVLKSILGGSLFIRFLFVGCLCTAASLPPVLNFFVEINILNSVGGQSKFLFLIFCFYLFFSSLVPLFLIGGCLSRQFSLVWNSGYNMLNYSLFIMFLFVWSFIIFLVI